MCKKLVDIYHCGHTEVDHIPCPSSTYFNDNCPMRKDDVFNNHHDKRCQKCVDLDYQIERMSKYKEFIAPVRPSPSAPPGSSALYFKMKKHWECNHYDPPTYTLIEREGSSEEFLVVEAKGKCSGCRNLGRYDLAYKILCREVDGADPYGASRMEPVAGPDSKNSLAPAGNEGHSPGIHPSSYLYDSDDEAYQSDYGSDEQDSQDLSVPASPTLDKKCVSRYNSHSSVDERMAIHIKPDHMPFATLPIPRSSQALPQVRSTTTELACKNDDRYNYTNHGGSAIAPDVGYNMREWEKQGKGKQGPPRRPFRNYSPSRPFEV